MPDTNLNIIISVKDGQVAATSIEGVATATSNVGTKSEEATKKTSGLKSALGGLATGFAVYKGYEWIKSAVEQTSDLAKTTLGLSRITGMDTKQASAWVGVAKERGISTSSLNTSFITLSRQMTAAASGTKASKEAFDSLGISQKSLNGMSTDQTINRISDAFAKMPNGANKAALAQKLFGRQAQNIIPLINQGSGALDEQLSTMARSVGVNGNTAKSGLALVKQQRELEATTMGLKVAVATALLPVLLGLSKVVLPIVTQFADLMKNSKGFRDIVLVLTASLIALIVVIKAIKLATEAWEAIQAILDVELTANPLGIVIVSVTAAIALFVALYEKVGWFHDAINAVWSWIKQNWPLLLGILLGPFALALAAIITHWNTITSVFSTIFGKLQGVVKTAAKFIEQIFVGAFNAIKRAVQGVIDAIHKLTSLPGKALGALGHIGGGALHAVGSVLHLQHGGTVGPSGTLALVGEAGPEIVALPGGSRVYPNSSIGNDGMGRQPIVTQVFLDKRQIALAMGDYMAGQQASR